MTTTKPNALELLKKRGEKAVGFIDGYEARDAIMNAAHMIRQMRHGANLTQSELAKRAGMTQPEISRLEAGLGSQGPSVETLDRLALACNQRLVMAMHDIGETAQTGEVPTLKYLSEI